MPSAIEIDAVTSSVDVDVHTSSVGAESAGITGDSPIVGVAMDTGFRVVIWWRSGRRIFVLNPAGSAQPNPPPANGEGAGIVDVDLPVSDVAFTLPMAAVAASSITSSITSVSLLA